MMLESAVGRLQIVRGTPVSMVVVFHAGLKQRSENFSRALKTLVSRVVRDVERDDAEFKVASLGEGC